MAKQLEMVFETGMGKTYRVTVADPRADATAAEIQAAMNTIITKDIFNVEGGLTGISEANIITTDVEAITFA
jgi:phosphoribosylaminoimidazole carboxylase (NCAIR synthetase)